MRFCIFLLFAGLLDAVLTHFGIVSGFITEGNPVMNVVIGKSWYYFYLIKISLPLLLLGLFYLRPLKGWTKSLLLSTCVLYLSVLVYHAAWMILYINTSF
ncbi:DUF5658 family protein [Neobacillus rhizosphaerae]|uniref:DUF5658 family protein n=1 Tax=Neobacillus rhizosphaerae TaxID=2880965 RepID=UPI003D2DF608